MDSPFDSGRRGRGKIEMIRRDPYMTDAQKAQAITDLQARR
jgi:hypothetical protein